MLLTFDQSKNINFIALNQKHRFNDYWHFVIDACQSA